jgi:2-amino-4-hydroxy-6-hydroxymethyldihydropteridine diphosphokinase
MTHIIYLSLGSNLGDRLIQLQTAISSLSPSIQLIAQSSVYDTEPWGYSDQPTFLNLVIKASANLDPYEVFRFLKGIEMSMGRRETFRYGPRLIDLDILFYDELVLDSPELTIPHPRLAERAFVLVPLAEIAPDLNHPVFGMTIQQLKSRIDSSNIKLFKSAIS